MAFIPWHLPAHGPPRYPRLPSNTKTFSQFSFSTRPGFTVIPRHSRVISASEGVGLVRCVGRGGGVETTREGRGITRQPLEGGRKGKHSPHLYIIPTTTKLTSTQAISHVIYLNIHQVSQPDWSLSTSTPISIYPYLHLPLSLTLLPLHISAWKCTHPRPDHIKAFISPPQWYLMWVVSAWPVGGVIYSRL